MRHTRGPSVVAGLSLDLHVCILAKRTWQALFIPCPPNFVTGKLLSESLVCCVMRGVCKMRCACVCARLRAPGRAPHTGQAQCRHAPRALRKRSLMPAQVPSQWGGWCKNDVFVLTLPVRSSWQCAIHTAGLSILGFGGLFHDQTPCSSHTSTI